MKTIQHTLILLTLLCGVSTTAVSCNNDHLDSAPFLTLQQLSAQGTNAQDGTSGQAVSIVGIWEHKDHDGDKDYYQFLADGTGFEWEIPAYAPQGFTPFKKPFTFTITAQTIVFREADRDIDTDFYKVIDANTLVIDGDTYRRYDATSQTQPQNDPQPQQTTVEEASRFIVGTWQHPDGDDTDYYQFLADGTGYEWDIPAYAPQGFTPHKKPFRYEVKQDCIIFHEYDGDIEAERFSILQDGNILLDDDIYSRL